MAEAHRGDNSIVFSHTGSARKLISRRPFRHPTATCGSARVHSVPVAPATVATRLDSKPRCSCCIGGDPLTRPAPVCMMVSDEARNLVGRVLSTICNAVGRRRVGRSSRKHLELALHHLLEVTESDKRVSWHQHASWCGRAGKIFFVPF